MTGQRLTFLPDILEEHLAEIGFLWGQRLDALSSPDYTFRDFAELDGRIMGHLAGVLTTGPRAPDLVAAGLESDDGLEVFAAAFALLHMQNAAGIARALDLFGQAAGGPLDGLRDALAFGPGGDHMIRVQGLSGSMNGGVAVAAAAVLARSGAIAFPEAWLRCYVEHEDPGVRAAAWDLIATVLPSIDPGLTARALADEDQAVVRAAVNAGAWRGDAAALEFVRAAAAAPEPTDLGLLQTFAVLAAPTEIGVFERILDTVSLGPNRFELAGTFGHPGLVHLLIAAMAGADAEAAAAAGRAFFRMTGVDVESNERAPVVPTSPAEGDDFDSEFGDDLFLPDAAAAVAAWQRIEPGVSQVTRLCRGLDMMQPMDQQTFDGLDMQSRREIFMRSRFFGTWTGSPAQLEVFPQTA